AGPAGAEAPTAVGRSAEPAASAAACAAPASGAVAAEPGRVVGHGREAVATATAGPRPGALAERLGRVLGDVWGPAPVLVCVAHGMCLLWFVGLRVIRGAVAGRSGLATVASSFSGSAIAYRYIDRLSLSTPDEKRVVPSRARATDVRWHPAATRQHFSTTGRHPRPATTRVAPPRPARLPQGGGDAPRPAPALPHVPADVLHRQLRDQPVDGPADPGRHPARRRPVGTAPRHLPRPRAR